MLVMNIYWVFAKRRASYNFGRFCLYFCQTITLEIGKTHVRNLYLHIRCISTQYGSSSYMKVIGSRSRSQDRKKGAQQEVTQRMQACQNKSASAHVQYSITNNSASIKHAAVKCACSIGFSLRPTYWRDRHLSYVTGSNYR